MLSRTVIVALMSLVFGVCSCQDGPSERDKLAHTIGLVRALSNSIEELDNADRDSLRRELLAAGQRRANGTNQTLLTFLNDRGLLGNAELTRFGSIGDAVWDGRLVFQDEWGRPLIVANSEARAVSIRLDRKPIMAAVPEVDGHDILIWSVGPDGMNQSGTRDDLASWRY